jgi:secreted trypsin-like serine protease
LRLKGEIGLEDGDGKKVGVVKLPEEDGYKKGEVYRVAGWGKTEAGAKAGGSTKLREGGMQAVTRKACSKTWGKEIGESQMCVEHSGTLKEVERKVLAAATSICDGDSGGPLVDEAGEVLVGVVSYGVASCDSFEYPNVFSFVFAAREWILENLK